MSDVKVVARFDVAKLVGANLGIDPEPSAERYAAAVLEGLRSELDPGVSIEVERGAPGVEVGGLSGDAQRSMQLRAEGVLRAIRSCGDWIVYR